MEIDALPERLQQLLQEEFSPGESVRWVAQPIPRGSPWVSIPFVLFGIPWTFFTFFWMAFASGVIDPNGLAFNGFVNLDPGRILFACFGIPFLLIGFGFLSTPLWHRWRLQRAASRTVYAITNRRAILIDGGYGMGSLAALFGGALRGLLGGGSQIRSFGPDKLRQINRVQREDGSGDILIEPAGALTGNTDKQFLWVGFYSIPEVKEIEGMLAEVASRVEAK